MPDLAVGPGLLVVVLLVLSTVAVPAHAGDSGHFAIQTASVEQSDGVYYLNASMQLRLSSDARKALHSGLPLTIRLDVELLQPRWFWMDDVEASLKQRYQLRYHALTERYVVRNLNSGEQQSFRTLRRALASLELVSMLPVIDTTLVPKDQNSYLRVRVALDADKLPGPLRLLAFWRRDWSIHSDWYRCPLPRR